MKYWFQSKMFWFNIVMTILGILTFLQTFPGLSSKAAGIVLLIQGVVNVILRVWFTDTGIYKEVIPTN